MTISSKVKKTISVASVLAATATATSALAGDPIRTSEDALNQLTGESQQRMREMCIAVTPYFITSMTPRGVVSSFSGLLIDGVSQNPTQNGKGEGQCMQVNEHGTCDRGFVKIMTTAPITCHAPIGL